VFLNISKDNRINMLRSENKHVYKNAACMFSVKYLNSIFPNSCLNSVIREAGANFFF